MKISEMAPSDAQTNVRLPSELKQWLQEQAEKSRRSFTAEVTARLEESRQRQTKGQQ